MSTHSCQYDIVIAGSGFSGTITALALHNSGFNVCLIEKGQHPRFAIGESSTPIADMILRTLSQQYDLPWLAGFSRYGSWQQAYPEVVCGIKRGFSYFKHQPGRAFSTTSDHNHELMVAASVSDTLSDTNWLRSDFDAFLVNKVREYGIDYFDCAEITGADRKNKTWRFDIQGERHKMVISGTFFIDATGSGRLADKLFAVQSVTEDFHTNSFAVFSHVEDLPRWMDILHQKNISTEDYPYDPDNSALHHVLDEGWIWMLRFNNNRTSWGFTLNGDHIAFSKMSAPDIWNALQNKYPDINTLLKNVTLSSQPGKIIHSGRLQRRLEKCYGEGWIAMPHTVGFVDPLFSSGIAWSLAGVERIMQMLCNNRSFGEPLYEQLKAYEQMLYSEVRLIDRLIAGCYQTMQHFPLFNAWSMLYFTFTIMYEQRRLKNLPVNCFLEADNPDVKNIVQTTYEELQQLTAQKTISAQDIDAFTGKIRKRIQPYNTAGLLHPSAKNMYHHTVAVL